MKKQIKAYVKELDMILLKTSEDINLLAGLISRLEEVKKKSELKHFIKTLDTLADHSKSGEEYKFLTKVVKRLTKILKG